MQHRTRHLWITAIAAAVTITASTVAGASALAEPAGPPQPVEPAPQFDPTQMSWLNPLGQTANVDVPAGQNPLPFVGEPPFLPPAFNPANGSTVGVAKPIYINFQRPIADRQLAESSIHISSNPPVPGKFYWMSDTQVRWRPIDFWPAGTVVNIDAAGTKSSFRVGDALVATIDDDTHQMQIHRNGVLEKTFPVSLGKPGYETPNGTYYVLEEVRRHRHGLVNLRCPGELRRRLQTQGQKCRPTQQYRHFRAQRAVVRRRSGQTQRKSRLPQSQPGERAVVLRPFRQRRPRRREELRRPLQPE